jgi:hypothetical protein
MARHLRQALNVARIVTACAGTLVGISVVARKPTETVGFGLTAEAADRYVIAA